MARPKNEELKMAITTAARKQFFEVGYNATSYRSVAEECGISRNLVQYHFPKKELLAIAFMESLLDSCMKELGLSKEKLVSNFASITQVGVLYFQKLVAKEGSRSFLKDVLRDRDLTESILAFNLDWALGHVTEEELKPNTDLQRTIILHMGGFYELLYWSLCNNREIDIAHELGLIVSSFAKALIQYKEQK